MFELNHTAEINALSVAKGKGDESPVCVTIGLTFETVGNEPVAAALGCREEDLSAFFGPAGDSRFSGITEIASWAEYEDRHEVSMLGFRCEAKKVSKIRVKPRSDGAYSLNCNIQLQDPPEHVIEKIAGALKGEYVIKLKQDAELPFGQAGEDEKQAA